MRVTYCIAELDVDGTTLSWQNSEIKTATITEEIDRSSTTLPINEVSITVIDADDEFDISNPEGMWNSLEYDQKLTVSEYVDGSIVDCGTFYLDGWSYKDNLATFEAVDAIGYIARRTFPGKLYLNSTAGTILKDIMKYGEFSDYSIDSDLTNFVLSGYLPESDCREALRCLCLAIGAVADCSRSSSISVSDDTRFLTEEIGTDRKLYGYTQTTLEESVGEIDFNIPVYTASDSTTTVYSGTVPSGKVSLSYSNPIIPGTLSINCNATYTYEETASGVTIKTVSGATLEVTGQFYTSSTLTLAKINASASSSDYPVTKTFSCPLYNLGNTGTIINGLITYYQMRKALTMKFLPGDEMVGDWVNIVDRNNITSSLYIKKQTIDLTGGFVSNAECLGYAVDVSAMYYGDNELYGEDLYII